MCDDNGDPLINITFGNRPELNGQVGTLSFSPVGDSVPLTFISNAVVQVAYPPTTGPVTLTYTLGEESESGEATFPEGCEASTTTTSVSQTTEVQTTTTTSSTTSTSTTLPETFTFGAAATVCVEEVPTIRINFLNTFPDLAGETGTLTFRNVNGIVVGSQPLVYQPGTTVDVLYPGTKVNPDGSIADVPGWNLNSDGFWVRDPSDEFLREGIFLTYEVNPTAGPVLVTYPPESSACANPDGPFPPGTPVIPPPPPGAPPVVLPATE